MNEYENNNPGDLFNKFLFDPGLNRDVILSADCMAKINEIEPDFEFTERPARQILTRKSILRVATSAILQDKNVGFVNLDIEGLRWGDVAGYGDVIINDLASVLEEVAGEIRMKHDGEKGYYFIPGRMGGDEFCFFTCSNNAINEKELKEALRLVKDRFSKKIGYYLKNEDQLGAGGQNNNLIREIYRKTKTEKLFKDLPEDIFFAENNQPAKIENKQNKIKDEKIEKTVIVANDTVSRDIILARSIFKGRAPESSIVGGGQTNVHKDEIKKVREKLKTRYSYQVEKNVSIFSKSLDDFLNNNPKYKEQVDFIRQLIKSDKSEFKPKFDLANYLFNIMREYSIDPLIEEPIFSFPDFVDNLDSIPLKERPKYPKMIYFYNPWLKVNNSELGYDPTDRTIIAIYEEINKLLSDDQTIKARGRGDYIYLRDKVLTEKIEGTKKRRMREMMIVMDKKNIPLGNPLYEGFPIFISQIDTPFNGGTDMFKVIKNSEDMARNNFYRWMNDQFGKDASEELIRYYLTERTNDRINSLLYWMTTFENPNEKFINFLIREKLNFALQEASKQKTN